MSVYHASVYPVDFILAVKKEYPERASLHEAMEAGCDLSEFLHRDLHKEITLEKIVQMIADGHAQELKAEAEKILRRQAIWKDFRFYWDRHLTEK